MIDFNIVSNNKKSLLFVVPIFIGYYITAKNILNFPDFLFNGVIFAYFFISHFIFKNTYNVLKPLITLFDKLLSYSLGLLINLFIGLFFSAFTFLLVNGIIIYKSLEMPPSLFYCQILNFKHSSKYNDITISFYGNRQLLYGTESRITDPKLFEKTFNNYLIEVQAAQAFDSIYVVRNWKIISK